MSTNPNTPSEYIRVPLGAKGAGHMMHLVTLPDGSGRKAYVGVLEATINPDPITKAAPLDIPLWDIQPDGSAVKFFRRLLFDGTGAYTGFSDHAVGGGPYAIVGVVQTDAPTGEDMEPILLAWEILPFSSTPIGFASAPATADRAEIHVWNTNVLWTASGVLPDEGLFIGFRNSDGSKFRLEATSEIANFRCLEYLGGSAPIGTGVLYIEYYKTYN